MSPWHRTTAYLALLTIGICSGTSADWIYLRNGHRLEGLIKKETQTKIVLDLGVGSTTISKSRIAAIKRSHSEGRKQIRQDWGKTYFLHEKYVPKGMKDLAAGFRALRAKREDSIRARTDLGRINYDLRQIRKAIGDLERRLVAASKRLESASPDENVNDYNALVVEINSIRADLTIKNDEIKQITERSKKNAQTISAYLSVLSDFESTFAERSKRHDGTADSTKKYFLETITARLAAFSREFAEIPVDAISSEGSTVVYVLVNDRVKGRFIFDTGAVFVTISEAFAKRLKFDTDSLPARELIVADGRKVKAKAVLLRSLQLGDARVGDVPAVVLPSPPRENLDGLLGMSFLNKFIVRLDGATGKMTLKQFSPRPD